MLINAARRIAFTKDVDGRPFVTSRTAEDREAGAEDQTGAVSRFEVGRHGLGLPAAKGLPNVATELVALRVVEPPDVLAQRVEGAPDPVARALWAISHLPVRANEPIPRVDLEASADVR